jgi:hypothetical protein
MDFRPVWQWTAILTVRGLPVAHHAETPNRPDGYATTPIETDTIWLLRRRK